MKSSRKAIFLIFTFIFFFSTQNSFSSEPDKIVRKGIASDSNSELSYYAEVNKDIMKNWSYGSGNIGANQDLYAIVVIKINPDGEISGFHFDKKSGDISFDSSVEKAVQLSNPLPPFSERINKESIELGIRFTPDLL